jgi:hypothetical protein
MNVEDLKRLTLTELTTSHGFSEEEAMDAVSTSMDSEPEFWDEYAEPESLAEYLATEEGC